MEISCEAARSSSRKRTSASVRLRPRSMLVTSVSRTSIERHTLCGSTGAGIRIHDFRVSDGRHPLRQFVAQQLLDGDVSTRGFIVEQIHRDDRVECAAPAIVLFLLQSGERAGILLTPARIEIDQPYWTAVNRRDDRVVGGLRGDGG